MGIRYVFFCILIFFSVFISSGHAVTVTPVCGIEKVNCSVNDGKLTGVLSKKNLSNSEHESQIRYLNLSRNEITGIDGDLWELLGKLLITLDLSFNKIEKFPTSNIDKLKSLKSLNLSSNQISGLEVSKFSQLQLTSLDISLNNLQVDMKFGDGFHNLSHLNLAGNNLSWESLESLGKKMKLTHLNISDSKISGKNHDAAAISELINLTHLDLSKNNLSEARFQSFKNLSNLVFLDVSDAGLHESASLIEILKLGNLIKLILSRNNYDSLDDLTSIANTSKVEYLDLSSNHLTGTTPLTEILTNLSKLNFLDLSNNSLNGSAFLAEILKLGNLTKLDLSSNCLGSNDSFSKAPVSSNLKYLDLSNNNLTGSKFITEILAYLSKLSFLDLSNNYLTGPIPTEILKLEKLTSLNLSRNSFSGKISNFARLPDLNMLDVSHNKLTGNISDPLKKKMEEMGKDHVDISGNRICVGNDSFLLSIGGSTGNCPDIEGPTKKKDSGAWKIALGVMLPLLLITMLIIFLVVACRRRKKLWGPSILQQPRSAQESLSGPFKFETGTTNWFVDIKLATSVPVVIINKPFLRYTFADLLEGTSGFDRESLVDEERFGLVYTGKLPDGHKISINVLDHKTRLANDEVAKYLERIGSMNHPNLAPLIGYCILGSQKMVIYDYMENGNLHDLLQEPSTNNNSDDEIPESRNTYAWIDEDNQIHNRTYEHQGQDTWIFRHRIALGIARGLAYLHKGYSLQIVHGNVRSRNIFLDSTFSPRLSNYGLDKLDAIEDDENPNGSMFMEVAATTESDVYDFGVLLFELVTGRNDVEWIRELVKKNTLSPSKVIDRKIRSSGDEKEMLDGLKIGYFCTSEFASKRPSMQQVIGLLKEIEPNLIVEFPN